MNIYFIGMCIAMLLFIIISFVVSKGIKNAEDYYVAGRRAPAILIAGSLIASYTSTGMFMGDAATFYDGGAGGMLILGLMAPSGYVVGAVIFGRYLRRSGALTLPEFFGTRFASVKLKNLASITAIVMMTVYLISVMQGIGTLMSTVTGLSFNTCIIIAMIVFTIMVVMAGSSGVLITDTLMAILFTIAMLIAALFIVRATGGWFGSIESIAQSADLSSRLSAGGVDGVVGKAGFDTVLWGFINGIVWMSVAMSGPWQTSRYMMAKDEKTIVSSSVIAAIGIFAIEFIVAMSAIFVNIVNPDLENSSLVMIWASMHLLPTVLGVILLTGVLSAGISSATTFLSLIGASFSNDIFRNTKNSIRTGRIAMVAVSVCVTLFCIFNPPALFWIMLFGGAVVAASWMPVALGSIVSKRLTRAGAFAGMLTGFVVCFVIRIYTALSGVSLPSFLDHAFIGMICNTVMMIIVSALTQVSPEEKEARAKLFVIPDSEKDAGKITQTLQASKLGMLIGAGFIIVLLVLWAVPYYMYK